MTISKTATYDRDFPERFQWGMIDNLTACNVALEIVAHIEREKRGPIALRHGICGLRRALNIMAEYVEA